MHLSVFSALLLFFLSHSPLTLAYPFPSFPILLPPPGCHYTPRYASGHYLTFTSPHESGFRFSISTEWTLWYPTVLRTALVEAGFSLLRANDSMSSCGWVDAGRVQKRGWIRGVVEWKDVRGTAGSRGWNATTVGARHVASQQLGFGPPQSYMRPETLSHAGQAKASTSRLWLTRNTTTPLVQSPFVPPVDPPRSSPPLVPRAPPPTRHPQPQTLDRVRAILATHAPDLDVALFLLEVVGVLLVIVLVFYLAMLLARALGRLLGRRRRAEDPDSDVELEGLPKSGEWLAGGPTKPEGVRVVPKGEEGRRYWEPRRVGVPMASSVYSRSVDGVTLYEH